MSVADEIANGLAKIISEQVHILAQGETLGSVVAKYQITLEGLYKANPKLRSLDVRKLKPGLRLKIPESPMGCARRLQGLSVKDMISEAAKEFGIDPRLYTELLRQETTTFDPNATSSAGAVGLAQLMPARVREFGLTDPKDPAQSLCAGAALLDDYLGKARSLGNNPDEVEFIALLMYNGGPTRVSGWLKNPVAKLPRETRNYAIDIFKRMGKAVPLRFVELESQYLLGR